MYDIHVSPSEPRSTVDARHLHIVDSVTPHLAQSPDPAVVFASLAQSSVPWFSDTCTIEVTELGSTLRIRYPHPTADDRPPPLPKTYRVVRPRDGARRSRHNLSVRVEVAPVAEWPAYALTATYTWRDRAPTNADAAVGQALLARAEAIVQTERHAHGSPECGPTGRPVRSWRLTPG